MSQSEAQRKWIRYTQLAIIYQQKADNYRASVTTRKVGILYSDQVARLAKRKAEEMLRWL